MRKKGFLIAAVLILLAAFGVVQYYIWGNAFLTEFMSDCTDTLLWAQATLESGSLFKHTFDYAYRLAFGGQWLFMPFLKLFGVGMTALRAGMCLFSLLFTAALFLFFRSLHHRAEISLTESAVMLMAVCSVKKTREIFFGHVIHYSLSVLYLLIAFILLQRCLSADSRRKRILPYLLLTLCLALCSANGTVEMLYVTLPFLAGCLIEWYLSRNKSLLTAAGCIVIASCAGFLFSKTLNTDYSDSYSVIVSAGDWTDNLLLFPRRWISLFYALPVRNLDAFSGVWIKTVFKSVIALMMLAGVILSFSRYQKADPHGERLFIFMVWAMFAAFLFFFVFGKISDVNWRLTPLWFSGQVIVLLLFVRVFSRDPERTISGGLALLCGLMLFIQAGSNALGVLRIPYDRKIWFAEDGLLETLKAHDLDYGYVTSYWLSNSITVISDDTVRARVVSVGKEGELYLNPFNSDLEWYNDQPDRDRWFLAIRDFEYDPSSALAQEAIETWTCTQEDTHNSRTENWMILVFSRNIMQDEYEQLLPRFQ